jgi:hypothetical protein
MAGPLLGGAVRNRQTMAESVSAPLFSAESKPKPSLSALKKSLSEPRTRTMRIAALLCASVSSLLYVMFFAGKRQNSDLLGRSVSTKGPSLADYPEVYVADSPPFKNLIGNNGVQFKSSRAAVSADARVPAESESTVAPGIDETGDPELRVIVLTMDREPSLRRLLASLTAADFEGDRVDLDIWIDRASTSDEAGETLALMANTARTVNWTQGIKTIHKRVGNAGLYEQWIYTWNVTEDTTEVAVILEDDLEVSPRFYIWLKNARLHYASDPFVAAFTLQRAELRPRQRPGVASGKLVVDASKPVFKYRLLGTWGFAPEKRPWLEFRAWYEEMRRVNARPYVDKLMTTNWYKSQEKGKIVANTMWSQWFIKFADVNDYFTVYANLPDGTTLASNYREGGLHYSDKPRKADFPVFKGDAASLVYPETTVYLDWDGLELDNRSSRTTSFRRPPSAL